MPARARLLIVAGIAGLAACGNRSAPTEASEPPPSEPGPSEPAPPEPAPSEPPPAEPPAEVASPRGCPEAPVTPAGPRTREQAVLAAEAFVCAHGYTDAPATITEADLRAELTDIGGFAEVMAQRHGSLEARAAGASERNGTWLVAFRYAQPRDSANGRGVRIHPDGTPEMVHQDVRLAAFLGAEEARRQPVELIMVGRLLRTAGDAPNCGRLHVGIEMEYEVLRVEQGSFAEPRIVVAHGCPEMTREMYGGPDAGTLTAFRLRDVHRLELVRAPPNGVSIIPFRGGAPGQTFWARRADPSAP